MYQPVSSHPRRVGNIQAINQPINQLTNTSSKQANDVSTCTLLSSAVVNLQSINQSLNQPINVLTCTPAHGG